MDGAHRDLIVAIPLIRQGTANGWGTSGLSLGSPRFCRKMLPEKVLSRRMGMG
jgi:hypothetical protein